MKTMALRAPGGLDRIVAEDRPDPGQPGSGEIRVALHGASLNYHDLAVATGQMKTADRRVLLADGAGIVESVGEGVGEGVTEFALQNLERQLLHCLCAKLTFRFPPRPVSGG